MTVLKWGTEYFRDRPSAYRKQIYKVTGHLQNQISASSRQPTVIIYQYSVRIFNELTYSGLYILVLDSKSFIIKSLLPVPPLLRGLCALA